MHLLNDEMMQAICWTLIHSLWQGLLLAVLAGLVIMLTKKSSSALRYNLLSVLFFLFVATACITFLMQYNFSSPDNASDVQVTKNTGQITNVHAYPLNAIVKERNYLETFTNYFNEHASLIVMIWFVVLSAHCIRLIANAGYVQRIRHYKTHAPSTYWNERMLFLAKKLQIKQRVKLVQSEIVKVPVMVGFLRPVILFPFQLMSQLPAEQVEAVLLHELAHIKRKDYFVNMLQSIAEIIFFFNPGVLWISSLIRDERENCCDDIAIRETKRKKEFVHALVSFQEYNLADSKYSLAFPGRKNHLLNRAKRILTNNNKTLNNMEKISLATGIVIIGLITIAFKQDVKQNPVKNQPATKTWQAKEIINDTVPDKKETTTFSFNGSIDGKKYRIKEINGKVVDLYIDEKKIPDEKIRDYQAIIDKLHLDAKKQQDELQAKNLLLEKQRAELMLDEEKMRKQQDEFREQSEKEHSETYILKLKAEQDELNARQNELTAKMEALRRSEEKINMEQSIKANQEVELQLKKQNEQLMMLTEELQKRQDEMRRETKLLQQKDSKTQSELLNKQILELKNEQLQIQQQRLKINQMLLNFNQNSSGAVPVNPVSPIIVEDNPVHIDVDAPVIVEDVEAVPRVPDSKPISSIIEDLIAANVITDKDNLSFTLNSEILKVNGIVQPKELHAKLKEKYIKGKKDHVIYSKHGGSTHTEVITHSE